MRDWGTGGIGGQGCGSGSAGKGVCHASVKRSSNSQISCGDDCVCCVYEASMGARAGRDWTAKSASLVGTGARGQ